MIDYEINYAIAEECGNYDAWYTCLKCGDCGRTFECGIMVNDGGTHPLNEEQGDR